MTFNRFIAWTALTLTALSLAACSRSKPDSFTGYVEGEYVYLSVPVSGYLASLEKRGAHVQAGSTIFTLDAKLDQKSLDQAVALSQSAQERVSNLSGSRRNSEIENAQANLRAAQSALDLANSRLQREQALAAQNFVSELALEDAKTQQRQAQAQWEAAKAQLKLAREPIGRNAERLAAESDFKAAQSVTEQKQWLLEHSTARADTEADVVDVYFRMGEWVPAGKPVASLLPAQGRLIRFFVPESSLEKLQPGTRVSVQCDGCASPIAADVEAVSTHAEYSPPVIYSKERREKLLFRIDARPIAGGTPLLPGLPVTVVLP
jgi:HlyD family secretion protein